MIYTRLMDVTSLTILADDVRAVHFDSTWFPLARAK